MPTVAYTLAAPDPRTHRFRVTVEARGFERDLLDLVMPVWAPGSYLVRDYARNVSGFEARNRNGRAIPWAKSDKTTWRVEADGGDVRASYDVYAHELSVQ